MAYNRTKVVKGFHILMTLITLLIVSCEIIYTVSCRRLVEQYARYSVEQNADEISKELDVYIDASVSSIDLTAQIVSEKIASADTDEIRSIIKPLVEKTPFDFIGYTDADGINYSANGEQSDVSDLSYFKNGMLGKTGSWIDYSQKYTNECLISFYSPVYFNGKITGILTGAIVSEKKIKPILFTTFYGQKMTGILCDENGHVISSTKSADDEISLSAVLSDLKISKEGKKEFEEFLDSGLEKNVFRYSTSSGNAIACTVRNKSTGWEIIQIVPPASFSYAIVRYTIVGYCTAGAICFLLFIYMAHIKMDSRKWQKEIIREKDMVVHNYEQILITTASDTYHSIRTVDLDSGSMDYIYFENEHVKKVETGKWTPWLEDQKKNIHIDDYGKITDMLNLDHLRFLAEGDRCRENYRSARKTKEGFYRYYTATASIITIDNRKTAIITSIENTEAVMNEIEQKRILASAASIYVSMHALDLQKNTVVALNSPPYISDIIDNRNTDIQEVLNDVMSKLTDEEYLPAMMEFIDFSTLDERMKGTKTITFEFIGTQSGWCRARFIATEYDDFNGKLSHVLWVVENIDAEKRKANQLLYLSETDLMTGIRNRGSGERRIKELIASGQQGMFCLLDADKFKSINDNYGHGVGDKVLISIAGCLKDSFRDSDVVMRLGGDEFAIFAVGVTEKESAAALIERFFDRIERISIPELGDRKISVSLGAAIRYARDGWDFDTLYQNADSCTYISKKITGCAYTFYGENNN